MCKNKLIIAAAGSGKTTELVKRARQITDQNVLITTYTEANEEEIRKKFNGRIPKNITIQTWFSFLLQHGVRPYQSALNDELQNKKIGFFLVSGISAQYKSEEKSFNEHYFTKDLKIYSDKIAKFVMKCDEKTNNEVINRISRIYPNIFIDEVQDLAGYDLEILKLLFNSSSDILLVGDPRQGTYSTNNAKKNKKFKQSQITYFFEDEDIKKNINIDDSLLVVNHRSNSKICAFSNKIFPQQKSTSSGQNTETNHDGVFLVRETDIEEYCKKYTCTILKEKKAEYPEWNWGKSKGLDFNRVLIYPTKNIEKWIKDNNQQLAQSTRCKFYVAVTRAKHSVAIVYDYKDHEEFEGITKWKTEEQSKQKAKIPSP